MRRTSLVLLLLLSFLGLAAPARAVEVPYDGVYGVVTDAKTGAPVAGIRIVESDRWGYVASTVTAADGSYALQPAGAATLALTDPTGVYRDTSVAVSANPGGAPVRQDVALASYPSISGRITDTSGNPLSGICAGVVVVSGTATTGSTCTGADGTYRVPVTAPATVHVQFFDPNQTYVDQWWDGVATEAKAKSIKAGATDVRNVNAKLQRGATITVPLRSATGEALRGCAITMANNNYVSGCAYEAGSSATIRGLVAGTYTVTGRAFDQSYVRRSVTVTVRTGQDVTTAPLVLPVGGRITGRALYADGSPVLGICASAKVLDLRTFPGPGEDGIGCDENLENGRFTIGGLEAGSYPVELVELLGPVSVATTFMDGKPDSAGAKTYALSLGQTVNLGDVTLPAQGTISGQVRNTAGVPVPYVGLVAHSAATGEQIGQVAYADDNGNYAIKGLGTNDYTVELYEDGTGNPSTYWPAASSAKKAGIVHVTAGAATIGINVTR